MKINTVETHTEVKLKAIKRFEGVGSKIYKSDKTSKKIVHEKTQSTYTFASKRSVTIFFKLVLY